MSPAGWAGLAGGGGGADGARDERASHFQHAVRARGSSGGVRRVVAVGSEATRSRRREGGSQHDLGGTQDDTVGVREAQAEDPIPPALSE